MKMHGFLGLSVLCGLAALATPASAAYPNGGIATTSVSNVANATFRTVNSELTRKGGFIFTTHFSNYWAENIVFAKSRANEQGKVFTSPLGSRFMGPDSGFNLYVPPGATFGADVSFNILYFPPGSQNVFNVTAGATNKEANWVYVDHPLANGNPRAVLTVQQLAQFGVGAPPPRFYGVWYHSARQRWAIFHQDTTVPMANGEGFDVFVAPESSSTFTVIANANNTRGNAVLIGSSLRCGKLIVTPNYAPRAVYNNHPVGVRVDPDGHVIFNEDNAPMPPGAAFNVVCDPY